MDVCVVFAVVLVECLDYLLWFLGGCGIVEVDELFSVDLALKDREVFSDS
jgi:hypothetical protein